MFIPPSIPSLPAGTVVGGVRVVRCLGAETGWIYYAAEREEDGLPLVLQEIFPIGRAVREGTSVWPDENWLREYQEILREARNTARHLAKASHRHVWRLRHSMEANGTLYFAFDWIDGPNLEQRLRLLGRPATPVEAGILLDQLLSAAEALHGAGLVHGSLDPERILMRRGEEPVIGGFKWFRLAPENAAVPASGYVALENDAATCELPVSCDVYSIAAMIYRAITGQLPNSPQERLQAASDPCLAALDKLRAVYPPQFLAALRGALQPRVADRIPDIPAWRRTLAAGFSQEALPEAASFQSPIPSWRPGERERTGRGKWLMLLGIAGVAAAGWMVRGHFLKSGGASAPPSVDPVAQVAPAAQPEPAATPEESVSPAPPPEPAPDAPPAPKPDGPLPKLEKIEPQKAEPAPAPDKVDSPAARPAISREALAVIADRIWTNECGHTIGGLTSWNAGENFASLGIAHFIWYPAGVEGPFEESFPALLRFLRDERRHALPAWLVEAKDCPWPTKKAFDAARLSPQMKELRNLLAATVADQAEFAGRRFFVGSKRLVDAAPKAERPLLQQKIAELMKVPAGMYALIDYVNFKGEGIKPEERYQGTGWGLLQVLQEMKSAPAGQAAAVEFSRAAAEVLNRRIKLSPKERHEDRWRAGWLNRCASYAAEFPSAAAEKTKEPVPKKAP